MKNACVFLTSNYTRLFHRKKKLLSLFFIPIIAIIVGIYANTYTSDTLSVGYVASDAVGKNKISRIDHINLELVAPSSIYESDLIMGKYDLLAYKKGNTYYYKQGYSNNQFDLKKLFKDLNADKTISSLDHYQKKTGLSPLDKTISFFNLLLFVTCTLNVSNMITDKNNGIYTRITTSPIRPIQYLWGNLGFNISITALQVLTGLLFIKLLGHSFHISDLSLFLYGGLVTLFAASFGILMNSLFSNELYANLSASMVALLFSLFGGTFIAYHNMPALFQAIGRFSPVRWFIELVNARSLETTLLYAVILLAASLFMVGLSQMSNKQANI